MRFLFIVLIFFTVILSYLYFRFITLISEKKQTRILLFFTLLAVIFLFFLTLTQKRMGTTGFVADMLPWISYTSLGFFSFLTTVILIRDFFLLIIKFSTLISRKTDHSNEKRRLFLSRSATSILVGGAISLTGTGFFLATRTPKIKKVDLPVKNLSKSLEGLSIVQLTDIHLGPMIKKEFLAKVVEKVNGLKPDIIAITGDLVDGVVEVTGAETEPLRALSAKYGKFFVTGNHEYYFNAEKWIRKVESLGFQALVDSHTLLNVKDSRILMAGVADYRANRFVPSHLSSPAKAIKGSPAADVKILLAHQPKSVFEAAQAGFDIQLSGHTHGGQFIPWQMAIGIDQPYLAGLYKHDEMMIYVSRGTGYWGPPMRLGAPSEITHHRLSAV